jgi:hypothetical protein
MASLACSSSKGRTKVRYFTTVGTAAAKRFAGLGRMLEFLYQVDTVEAQRWVKGILPAVISSLLLRFLEQRIPLRFILHFCNKIR